MQGIFPLKSIVASVLATLFFTACCCQPPDIQELSGRYIEEWKLFYPTEAFAAGHKGSAVLFENFNGESIKNWIGFNEELLTEITRNKYREKLSMDDRIDMNLLERKIRQELNKWKDEQVHLNSPSLYGNLISQSFTHLLARPLKNRKKMRKAVLHRLEGVGKLCDSGLLLLKDGPPLRSGSAAAGLEKTAEFYSSGFLSILEDYFKSPGLKAVLTKKIGKIVGKVRKLSAHIRERVIPSSTISDLLGKERYNRKLRLYTGMKIHSLKLQNISLTEIERVRDMIGKLSVIFWKSEHPGNNTIPPMETCIQYAFGQMESHRVDNSAAFLAQFKSLIDRAEKFAYEKNITSIRDSRSLITALSPSHFAGAAIGGVYPAGPFDPEADTLFYLPTVPDDAPEEVKDGFYRSFNNHFNTMIITHEIFPGHYFQLKESSKNKRIIRTLLGDDLFIEGWATLCEQITLDRGWDGDHPLTRLAHLRKRLENAVRAYTSVQVHCNQWTRDQLTNFAEKRGLLAPQFAENLWHRVVHSPLQLTSYFLGFRQFSTILEEMKKNRDFNLQKFCDKTIRSGSIPMDLLDPYIKTM